MKVWCFWIAFTCGLALTMPFFVGGRVALAKLRRIHRER